MRDNHPEEWQQAIRDDAALRNLESIRGEGYIHRSMLPLDQAPIDRVTPGEWNNRQLDLLDVIAEDGDPDGCSPYGCRSGAPA